MNWHWDFEVGKAKMGACLLNEGEKMLMPFFVVRLDKIWNGRKQAQE